MHTISGRVWPEADDVEDVVSFVGTRLRVLVADDDPALRQRLGDALSRDGFVVSQARDGEELLEIVQATLDEEGSAPELVIADLSLPGLGGLDALGALCARITGSLVLVTSRRRDEGLVERARAAGAFDVLEKPLDLDVLRCTLATVQPRGD